MEDQNEENGQGGAGQEGDQENAGSTSTEDEAAADSIVDELAAGKVMAVIPKAYNIRLSNQSLVRIEAGTQLLDKSLFEHPYSKANGVTLFTPASESKDKKPGGKGKK